MDSAVYESLKREIFDGCMNCKPRLAALDVVFEKTPPPVPSVKRRGPGKKTEAAKAETIATEKQPLPEGEKFCERCKGEKIRLNAHGCESCSKRVCKSCKSVKDPTVCIDCEDPQ